MNSGERKVFRPGRRKPHRHGGVWLLIIAATALLWCGWPRLVGAASGRTVRWKTIGPGLEMKRMRVRAEGNSVLVTALRTTPERIRVGVGAPREAAGWRQAASARAAVNGGFFDPEGRSLGLRITRGRELRPLRRVDWGVFYIRRGRAYMVHTRNYSRRRGITEALQCGPRLVVGGTPTRLKPQYDRRTGIGIQSSGRVVLAVADGEISFDAWARLWAMSNGLDCPHAMNLDGGSSSQLALHSGATRLEVAGGRTVPDVVLIY